MKITVLGQGYEATSKLSVGKHLMKFLANKDFHSFTGFSAFLSQSGIRGLSKHIEEAKKHLKKISIVTGIDQKGTSKEALEELLRLRIKAYIYFQPSRTIFHPKIYLFEGKDKSELIIGSSNLTSQGLFTNVEASLLVSINNNIETDREVIDQLKAYFKGIFDYTDPNLKKITKKIINDLVKVKIVPTEAERKATQDKAEKSERDETEKILTKIFPKRPIAKVPNEFRGTSKLKEILDNGKASLKYRIKSKPSKLIWESGPLSERDLNIPKGSNTNPTGSMLFKKGKMENIDQRHYFRDNVFSSLIWLRDTQTKTCHLERAYALFKIIVDGIDFGDFKLPITHNTKTDSKAYKQKNSMTSISWGKAKAFIAKEELIGKNARLYKNKGINDEFTLVID